MESEIYFKVQYSLHSNEELKFLEVPKPFWASGTDFNFSASLM